MATLAPPLLAGRYRLLRRLGSGGFGQVYLATDPAGTRVAVKILAERWAADPEYVARFAREAELGAAIRHPNVVRVLGHSRDGSTHFLVTEWVDGHTLADHLRRHGAMPLADALALIRQVLAGLEAIHRQGIVLLDFKPANVLIDRHTGVAKIADFGAARTAGAPQAAGELAFGTPPYMAPEQRTAQGAGRAADLYAAGCVLYEMLAGKPLLGPDRRPPANAPEAALAGLQAARVPVTLDVAATIYQALSRDPVARFRSAAAMAAALGDPPAPAPAAPPRPTPAPARRPTRPARAERRVTPYLSLPRLALVTTLVIFLIAAIAVIAR